MPTSSVLPGPHSGYELLCPIGQGWRGWVWRAYSAERPNLKFAVKFFTGERLGTFTPAGEEEFEALVARLRGLKGIHGGELARPVGVLDLRPFAAQGWPALAVLSELIEPSLQGVL